MKKIWILLLVLLVTLLIFYDSICNPDSVRIDNTLPACILTQDGNIYTSYVKINGEVLRYRFSNGTSQFFGDIEGGIWINDYFLTTYMIVLPTNDSQFAHWPLETGGCMMDLSGELFVGSLDLQQIFPDEKSQQCVIVAPATEKSDALSVLSSLSRQDLDAQYLEIFDWFINE